MKDEDIEVEERYKLWIEEAAHELGMDICAMDGKEGDSRERDARGGGERRQVEVRV